MSSGIRRAEHIGERDRNSVSDPTSGYQMRKFQVNLLPTRTSGSRLFRRARVWLHRLDRARRSIETFVWWIMVLHGLAATLEFDWPAPKAVARFALRVHCRSTTGIWRGRSESGPATGYSSSFLSIRHGYGCSRAKSHRTVCSETNRSSG
jgi:hypothetical protein